jgi:hypothetical protein
LQQRRVGERIGNVARLHVDVDAFGRDAHRVLEQRDEAHQVHRRASADIDDAVGRDRRQAVGRGDGLPAASDRCRWTVDQTHDGLDDVVDEREVASHAAVIVDLDRATTRHGVEEFVGRHVGPAPRSIDREET